MEAADQRAEDTERERDSAMASYEDYLRIRHERDAALAMIEKVQGEVSKGEFDPDLGDWADELLALIDTAPAEVLREHDAKVRAEELREAAEEADDWKAADGMHGGEWFPSEWAGQVAGWLEHRAARIREQGKEQGS